MKKNILIILLLVGIITACSNPSVSPESGQNLALQKGCAACHSVDETDKIGPITCGIYKKCEVA